MLVPVELSRILIREMTDTQFITLKESDGDRSFPIAIGLPEAQAIERRLRNTTVPRPQTHDLLSSVINGFGGEIQSIIIHTLEDGTFYANLIVAHGEELLEIDSRPSDAIALGVAEQVPIFVSEEVLVEASSACDESSSQTDIMSEDESEEDDDDSWI